MYEIINQYNYFCIDCKFSRNFFNTMYFRLLAISTVLLINSVLFSQTNTQEDKFYKRYQGSIGENINVTANIIRLYDNISGNYVYYFINENNEMYYGKTIELSGNINKYDSLKLREFGSEDYTFLGLIEDGQYEGVWNAEKEKPINFHMEEYYPNGSLPFEIYYLKSEKKLDKNSKDSPVAEIELTLVYPSNKYFQPAIADSVKNIVARSYFGNNFNLDKPELMLENFEKEYFDNYNKQVKSWHDTEGASFNWEKMMNMSVIYNSNYIICTEYLRYAYAGGTHGMTNLSYDIINIDLGTEMFYKDIFIDNIDSALTVMLTDQIRVDYEIPKEVKLTDAGFFADTIKPNKNLFVDSEGIGFVYNSYEIAPYSRGATKILLDFDKIKHFVKQGTPIYKMSHR